MKAPRMLETSLSRARRLALEVRFESGFSSLEARFLLPHLWIVGDRSQALDGLTDHKKFKCLPLNPFKCLDELDFFSNNSLDSIRDDILYGVWFLITPLGFYK